MARAKCLRRLLISAGSAMTRSTIERRPRSMVLVSQRTPVGRSVVGWWGVDDSGGLVAGGLDGGAGRDPEGGVALVGDDLLLKELSAVVKGEADGLCGGLGV